MLAILLLVTFLTRRAARSVVAGVGTLYPVFTVDGILGNGHDLFGLIPLDARDLIVHPLLAVLAAVVLLIPLARRATAA